MSRVQGVDALEMSKGAICDGGLHAATHIQGMPYNIMSALSAKHSIGEGIFTFCTY